MIGLFVANLFDDTPSPWRTVGVIGLVVGFGSFLVTISMLYSVQVEIKARYLNATNGEKTFLIGLFYFVRGIFLLAGILILISSLSRKDVLENDLIEVGGRIASIEVYGGDSSDLKIIFENNSNEYESRTFRIPERKLDKIENELQPGDFVFVLIKRNDEHVMHDPYVQIYGIRTDDYDYLSLAEYNKEDSANNSLGFILGVFLAGSGLVYLIVGRIKTKPHNAMRIDQNISKA